MAGAVLVVVAVVVAIVLANRSHGDENTAAPTTTTNGSRVPLEAHRDPWGSRSTFPRVGSAAAPTVEDPISDVIWESRQTDPTVGPLKVQVRRDTTVSGVSANTYLTEEDQTQRQNQDKLEYHRLVLSDDRSSADLGYTYRAAAGSRTFACRCGRSRPTRSTR